MSAQGDVIWNEGYKIVWGKYLLAVHVQLRWSYG